jgi:DNA-binding NtrC family response regulator
MSQGPTITIEDIMPRHLRASGETPAVVTLQVGSTLAEARRQLVLRTLSMTGGDTERTAKMLGMSPGEVRSELAALVGANGEAEGNGAAVARNVKARVHGPGKAAVRAKGRR